MWLVEAACTAIQYSCTAFRSSIEPIVCKMLNIAKTPHNRMSREGEATSAVPREPNTGIQVISRAASILRTLKEHKSGMSLGQIAEKINLPRSTVQRIVSALEVERLLISSSRGGGIRLGPELRSLGIATSFNVVERCRPHLESLNLRTGETVDLSVLRGRKMIFLDQIQRVGPVWQNSALKRQKNWQMKNGRNSERKIIGPN